MLLKRVRGVLFLSFVLCSLVLFSGFVSAVCSAGSSDVLLRLSSQSNAHAEVYNGVNGYSVELCYSTLFGSLPSSYSGSEHVCTGSNSLGLWLSASSNAHASVTSDAVYATEVCYGDLSCSWVTTGSCLSGDVHVLSLSSQSNAHLEDPSGSVNNYVPSVLAGSRQLCCRKQGVAGGSLQWHDSSGLEVSSVYIDSFGNVTLTAVYQSNNGTPDNSFSITERDGGVGDDVLFPQDRNGTVSGSDFVYAWTPTFTEVDNVADDLTEGQSAGQALQFVFSIDNMTSSSLDINYCGNADVNDGGGEECDDGNVLNGDGCSSTCQVEVPIFCGNKVPSDVGESCDCGLVGDPLFNDSSQPWCDAQVGNIVDASGNTDCVDGTCDYCSDACQLVSLNVNDVYFTDLNGVKITEAFVGDTVIAFFPEGASAAPQSFRFFEDDSPYGDAFHNAGLPPYDDDLGLLEGRISGSNLVAYWTLDQDDFAVGEPGLFDFAYRFEVPGVAKAVKDVDVLALFPEDDPFNEDAELTSSITGPSCGEVVVIGSSLSEVSVPVSFSVKDADDLVKWTLTVGSITYSSSDADQCGSTDPCAGGLFTIPSHTFSGDGVVSLELRAQSYRNGLVVDESLTSSNIVVVDKNAVVDRTFVAACIDEPENHIVTGSHVRVLASSTKAVSQPAFGLAHSIHSLEGGDILLSWDYGMSDISFSNPYPQDDSRSWDHQVYYKEPGKHTLSLTAEFNPLA